MSTKLQPVRGTHDLLPQDSRAFRYIEETARSIAEHYGYGEIMTPVFEFSDVFHRTLGDTSDVVTKETYSFTDRGGEELTLRPEFTASIARAFISGSLQDQLPLRFFYAGPAFRYERPQKGRQRQFHQLGAELLGVAEPQGDVETIALAYRILKELGLHDKIQLEINTLGDRQSRAQYRNALVAYLQSHASQLSPDSQTRLQKNPLRVLDSKDENDRQIVANAPRMQDAMTPEASAYFKAVTDGLDALDIAYNHNERLVRGLDYYSHTVFEFTTTQLGAQGTVLAGGRYDGLIELMGGPSTPGIGWAAGIERLMALSDLAHKISLPRPIALIPLGDAAQLKAMQIAENLRDQGITVDMAYKGNLSNRMKKANKANAIVALILGEAELEKNMVMLKDLDNTTQQEVALDSIISALAPYHQKR